MHSSFSGNFQTTDSGGIHVVHLCWEPAVLTVDACLLLRAALFAAGEWAAMSIDAFGIRTLTAVDAGRHTCHKLQCLELLGVALVHVVVLAFTIRVWTVATKVVCVAKLQLLQSVHLVLLEFWSWRVDALTLLVATYAVCRKLLLLVDRLLKRCLDCCALLRRHGPRCCWNC
jgi:hypothetical protein